MTSLSPARPETDVTRRDVGGPPTPATAATPDHPVLATAVLCDRWSRMNR